jgi:hypothetical protein
MRHDVGYSITTVYKENGNRQGRLRFETCKRSLQQGDTCNKIPISKASLDADFVGVTSQVFENLCNCCIENVRTMTIQ